VAAGQQPFRDFVIFCGPLTVWLQALAFKALGVELWVARLWLVLDLTVLTVAVYSICRITLARLWAAGISFLWLFLAIDSPAKLNVNHRWDSAAFAVVAIALVARSYRSPHGPAVCLAAGVFAALAAWATPSVGVVGLALLGWLLWFERRPAVAFLAGAALCSLVVLAELAAGGALQPMVGQYRWIWTNYRQPNALPYGATITLPADGGPVSGWKLLYRVVENIYWRISPALPPLGVPAVLLLFWRKRCTPDERKLYSLLAACSVALVVSAYPRWSAGYLIYVSAVPWALFFVLLFRSGTHAWIRWTGVAVLVFAIGLGAFTAGLGSLRLQPIPSFAGRLEGTEEQARFLAWLENSIEPGETLAVLPYMPSINFYTGTTSPMRHLFLQPGMSTAEDEAQVIRDLSRNPPAKIVWQEMPPEAVLLMWPRTDVSRIGFPRLESWIRENYEPAGANSSTNGVFRLWRRR
jgi:4-amino-4-deoxy-L-arabinose transferase-like glycosyltransferase